MDIPSAIMPEYPCGLANESVELYRGPIEFADANGRQRRDATVKLDWLPGPRVAIHSRGPAPPIGPGLAMPVPVRLPELGITLEAYIACYQGSPGDCHLTLALLSNASIGQSGGFSSVVFHVVNLRHYRGSEHVKRTNGNRRTTAHRLVLETGGWRITLDSVDRQNDIIRSLSSEGGHAITYVGRLERANSELFAITDFEDVSLFLVSFLSFLNGDSCSVVLPVAYDVTSQRIWRGWSAGDNAPWISKPNWSKDLPGHVLAPAFPGFLRRWQDPEWHEPIGQAIAWYVQGKRGTPETALLLGQSALELIGWVQFVESINGTMSAGSFHNLSASERIRLLLDAHAIGAGVPNLYVQLNGIEIDGKRFDDGPHAITAVRNGVVHPKKSKRQHVLGPDPSARIQAANLCLYYLECVLLSLFDYKELSFIPGSTLLVR